jgi:hypothetical protein
MLFEPQRCVRLLVRRITTAGAKHASTRPEDFDGVLHHLLVRRGDEQIVLERLANQHPIERIAVM